MVEADLFERNVALNDREIAAGRLVLESRPKRLGVTVTTLCNLKCIMCRVIEIPWKLPPSTIREVTAQFPYLEYLFWLGGEVFYSDQFERLFEGAAAHPRLAQALFTNGLLLNDRWAKRLVETHTILSFSIDAFTPALYEQIRRGARFERLLQGIELINKHRGDEGPDGPRFRFGMNFTTMRENYREIPAAVSFARRHGFQAVTINLVDEGGDPKEGFMYADHDAARAVEAMLPDLVAEAREHGIDLRIFLPNVKIPGAPERPAASVAPEKLLDGHESGRRGVLCHLPWQHLFIGDKGEVRPHCLCRVIVGDVNKQSLDEIWNGEGMQRYRRTMLEEKARGFCNDRCVEGAIPERELKF